MTVTPRDINIKGGMVVKSDNFAHTILPYITLLYVKKGDSKWVVLGGIS